MPEKTTAKTVGGSLLKHFSRLPFYLGIALFFLIGGILGTSYLLGYDNYIGLHTSDPAASEGRRSPLGGRAGAAEAEAAIVNDEELGLDDFVENYHGWL
ncbi:hypothetical protein BC830DRAFT_1172515 [Chytriomyces sp. MP71]|nr:hypothetical protein BC830DRAFT_1172515 [Chytriomyces sp. MP71]